MAHPGQVLGGLPGTVLGQAVEEVVVAATSGGGSEDESGKKVREATRMAVTRALAKALRDRRKAGTCAGWQDAGRRVTCRPQSQPNDWRPRTREHAPLSPTHPESSSLTLVQATASGMSHTLSPVSTLNQ